MGQNLDISDAVLLGYQGDNIECMDKVITKWKSKGHEKVLLNNNNYIISEGANSLSCSIGKL